MFNVDHRRTERRPVVLSALFNASTPKLTAAPFRAQVVNLNHTGVRLHGDKPIAAGICGTLTLLRDQTVVGRIEARIVWSARDAAGACDAGLVFRNLSPDDEYMLDLQWIRSAV